MNVGTSLSISRKILSSSSLSLYAILVDANIYFNAHILTFPMAQQHLRLRDPVPFQRKTQP